MAEAKTLVIIPAYNEEKSVGNVIRAIHRHMPEADVVVVNDGSRDRTAQVARRSGAIVLDLPYNVGIGGGMQTGYMYAHRRGYDYAVQIDADGQHDPAELPKLMEYAKRGEADMILASRYIGTTEYKSTAMRRIGMVVLSYLVSKLSGQETKDTTSGYRVVNRRVIEQFSRYYPADYPEPESLVYLMRNQYRVLEVPVQMHQRQAGASSITPLKSIYYMVKVSLALFMNALRHPKAGNPL